MLTNEKAVTLKMQLEALKETVQSLEIFAHSIYWGTAKAEPDEQAVNDSLEWLGKGIKNLLEETHALANWFKEANKTDYLTACTPAKTKTTGELWARIESELFAMSEQLELAGNEQHEKADNFYYVANQLHALNKTGAADTMTQKQKQAFFSLVEKDYFLIASFNRMKQEHDRNRNHSKTAKKSRKGCRK